MSDDLDDRMRRVEDTLWGPWRNNGLVADVRAIRAVVEKQEREEAALREAERKERLKNRLTMLGIGIAGFGSLLTAILTVSQG